MANSKQEKFYDCAIVFRNKDDDETCLKFRCQSYFEAVTKLENCPIDGEIVSFMFGDFHTIKK